MYNSAQGGKISRYLRNKRTGGATNQTGNEYEIYFACNLICHFTHSYPNEINNIYISSQADASIDDLYVNYCNKTHHYYQLKTSKYLSWDARKTTSVKADGTKKKSLPLKFDFWLQKSWCELKNQRCKLHLIVAEKSVQLQMTATKPKFMPNVSIDCFPHDNTATRLLYTNVEFRNNISALCAVKEPTLNILATVANCIAGVWHNSGRKYISINDLLSKIKSIDGSFIKYPLFSTLKISHQVDLILSHIPNFSYEIDNEVFIWKYGKTDFGMSPYSISSTQFSSFEYKVIENKPTNFQELENLLILLS